MSSFYPPYQFIPVTGEINGERDAYRYDYADIADGACTEAPTVRQDLWHRDGLSGRLVCSMHLDTPTLVGAVHKKRHGNRPVRVPQYEWRGRPALPANSLKGMISAVAEALSQSALRVLSEKRWSYRVKADAGERPDRFGTVKTEMKATLAEQFAKIDPNLPPWSKDRDRLTPAELLFGAVELDEKGENPDAASNLAGRVRLRDARLVGEAKPPAAEVTLRLLSSPNQPCPSMYYHIEDQRGGYVSKQHYRHHEHEYELLPNGRKLYLHHPPGRPDELPDWESRHAGDKHDKDRMCCRPMAAGQWFLFPIDFDNLTPGELTLLLRSLEPGPGFRHRLGLGKPLGLGSVALAVEGMFLIDRAHRYSPDGLLNPSRPYHRVWRPERPAGNEAPPDWSQLYPLEWDAFQTATPCPALADLTDDRLIDRDTLAQLLALGDRTRLEPGLPVRTPLLDTQHDPESKTYEWFVANDRKGHQAMPAVDPAARFLPGLYASMEDARLAGTGSGARPTPPARPPAGPAMPEWLGGRIDGLLQHQSLHTEDDVLQSKMLAVEIRELAANDAGLAAEVFDALNRICRDRGLLFTGRALTIYGRLGFKPWYQPG